jgi:hypothetical protein
VVTLEINLLASFEPEREAGGFSIQEGEGREERLPIKGKESHHAPHGRELAENKRFSPRITRRYTTLKETRAWERKSIYFFE